MVSACKSWVRFFTGGRKSDNSGKKLKIGSLMLPIGPRSIASGARQNRRNGPTGVCDQSDARMRGHFAATGEPVAM